MPIYGDVDAGIAAVQSSGHADPLAPVQVELNGYFRTLTTLNAIAPTECFQTLSGISARASEIRNLLMVMDSRRSNALRLRSVDPLLEEVDRQFKIHSRIQAVRQMEFDTSKGQT